MIQDEKTLHNLLWDDTEFMVLYEAILMIPLLCYMLMLIYYMLICYMLIRYIYVCK